ncbi:hypothetical protein [Brevundimonas sp.]|uniref:hypothetical protein n=1 Tax=Brevundimonas sp. TaxID=1871086 RepID=UPI002ABA3B6F|nr:hypothetical protein [Brevundimonas sp.]MDZ4365347.1 hypothetical protein [Brevundimonas sp.]
MTQYTVPQAKDALDSLIHRASQGETVSIVTTDGSIARLVIVESDREGPRSAHDVEWFDRVRVKPRYPSNSVETMRAMRAEYRY